MILFHATHVSNIRNILKHGLRPQSMERVIDKMNAALKRLNMTFMDLPQSSRDLIVSIYEGRVGKVFLTGEPSYALGNCLAGWEAFDDAVREACLYLAWSVTDPNEREDLFTKCFQAHSPFSRIRERYGDYWEKGVEEYQYTYCRIVTLEIPEETIENLSARDALLVDKLRKWRKGDPEVLQYYAGWHEKDVIAALFHEVEVPFLIVPERIVSVSTAKAMGIQFGDYEEIH